MFWDIWEDATQEEEEKLLENAMEYIEIYKIESIALILLETMKPLVYVGGEFSRFLIAPLLPFLNHKADAFIQTFEQRKNIEKLITMIEEKIKEKQSKKKQKNLEKERKENSTNK